MRELIRLGANQKEATKIADGLYLATGFSNTFAIVTKDGSVIVDTSLPFFAVRHKKLLDPVITRPIKGVILTHAHEDHTGGLKAWLEPGTQIITGANFPEMIEYQDKLRGFYASRNAAQFAFSTAQVRGYARTPAAHPKPTILVADKAEFRVGSLAIEIHQTPGETYDHCSVWIPEWKAAFVGDNFYPSFPNIYTLRGTRPRWALDYVDSLNKVLSWKPRYLLPSHGDPIVGEDEVRTTLTRYRDAIRYVHDAVVAGMNEGKDVFTLMREIKLPASLDVGESYGRLTWSIRGIYEGYVGWFDGEVANMYEIPASAVDAELVTMAGGPDKVAQRAGTLLEQGKAIESLHLANAALRADPRSAAALRARSSAIQALRTSSRNIIEQSWLDTALERTRARIEGKSTGAPPQKP